MNFKKVFSDPTYHEGYWLSAGGKYKIVTYDNSNWVSTFRALKSGFYAAYYKPKGWKCFGNNVDKNTPFYRTLKEAQTACELFDKNRRPDQ